MEVFLFITTPFILFLIIIGIIKYKIKQRQIRKAVEKAIRNTSNEKKSIWDSTVWDIED